MDPLVYTYADALDHLDYFLQGHGESAHQAQMRRCVQAAYREITAAHDWSFLQTPGRIQLVAAQTTGTVTYDHTGGTYERMVTSTVAWPSWVEDASIRMDSVVSDVELLKDNADPYIVTLDATNNPGADVAALTTYTLYPRWYALPADFVAFSGTIEDSSWLLGEYVTPKEWLQLDRYRSTTGDVQYYTIMSVPDLYGQMGLFVHPASDSTETIDFIYKRRPRPLRYSGYDSAEAVGTVSATADSATLTGSGTSFDDAYVGSVIRIGTSTTYQPTGLEGAYPYAEQRSIEAVTSGTTVTLTMDAAAQTSRSGVKYRITDPIDIDVAAWDAFLGCCEKHMARIKRMKDADAITRAADLALRLAKGADSRVRQRRVAGDAISFRRRLADYTDRPTVDFS